MVENFLLSLKTQLNVTNPSGSHWLYHPASLPLSPMVPRPFLLQALSSSPAGGD